MRDVRKIIGCKMSSRDTEEYRMYSLIAGKGWLRFLFVMIIFNGPLILETKLDDFILLTEIQDWDENPIFIYRRQTCSILLPML